MSEESANENRRGEVEFLEEAWEWPQFYMSGEDKVDEKDFAPAFWMLEGPNGPVMYQNQAGEPHYVTMFEFAMEPTLHSFRQVQREETPWSNDDEYVGTEPGDFKETNSDAKDLIPDGGVEESEREDLHLRRIRCWEFGYVVPWDEIVESMIERGNDDR